MVLKLQNLAMDVLHLLDFQGLLPFYYFQTCAHMPKELKRNCSVVSFNLLPTLISICMLVSKLKTAMCAMYVCRFAHLHLSIT
jgi:hypothetical protein